MSNRRSFSLMLCFVLCLVALLALLLLTRSSTSAQGGTTRYVAPSGDDAASCTDPDQPCRTVQYTVDAAVEGDVIKVAAGEYTDVHSRPAPPGYPNPPPSGLINQVVCIDKGVTIRGGYTAPGYADPPDPAANPSTLDAQGQGRVLFLGGSISPTLEGLHITGGSSDGQGGGRVGYDDSGGGVYVLSATVSITNSQVFSNAGDWKGGGLYLNASSARLSGNTINDNTAFSGSGLMLVSSSAILGDNTIAGNSYGGGLRMDHSSATLKSNTISANSGPGVALVWDSDATLIGNTVNDNYGAEGHGVYVSESSATLDKNTICSNGGAATAKGGGVYLYKSHATLTGNTICSNESTLYGAGLSLYESDATLDRNTISYNFTTRPGSDGGGLYLDTGYFTLTNNIITDNRADGSGSGLWFMGNGSMLHNTLARNAGAPGISVFVGQLTLTNTILVSHTIGIQSSRATNVALEATQWGTGTWANDIDWAPHGIVTGTVNVWGDPAFVDPDAGDYHIGLGSAAVDTGVDAGVTMDIDGELRPMGAGYDIGADEVFFGPRLAVAKRAIPERVRTGALLTYTLYVTNTGTVSLTSTITDILPAHVTATGTVNWMPPPLLPDGTWQETVLVTVETGYLGPLTNVVQVSTEEGATGAFTHTLTVYTAIHLPLVLRNAP